MHRRHAVMAVPASLTLVAMHAVYQVGLGYYGDRLLCTCQAKRST
jgi:hypothetical protein